MKIALLIEYFDAARGGTEQFTAWLAGQLLRAGHEVHVVCHASGGRRRHGAAVRMAPEPAVEGLHIHALGGPRLCTGAGFRLFGWRAARWCRRHRPDVMHSMTVAFAGDLYQSHAGVYAELQAQAIASRPCLGAAWKRLVFCLPGKQRTLLSLEARATRPHQKGGPVRIVSLSPMSTRHFRRHYPIEAGPGGQVIEFPDPQMKPPPDVQVAREGRTEFRRLHRLADEDRVAVFVGHDFQRKGLRFAIEATARTQRWKLLVAGLGRTREYVEQARGLGMGGAADGERRILFVGATQDMDQVYAASDALILPTFYDSFGLVAIEALAHGLPVISTEFLGAAYLVRNHQAGTIVGSPEETGPMAEALDALPAPGSRAQTELAQRARAAGAAMPPDQYLETLQGVYQLVQREKFQAGGWPPVDSPRAARTACRASAAESF